VVADDFNPEKYQRVGKIFLRTYLHTEDPSAILKQFLSLVVDGSCSSGSNRKSAFSLADYDSRNPHEDHQVKRKIE
jgi:hypothetical protein